MFAFLRRIESRRPLVRYSLPAGRYQFNHDVDPVVGEYFRICGEVDLPEADLETQMEILAETTNIQNFRVPNDKFHETEATTFLFPTNVNNRNFRKKMRTGATRDPQFTGFVKTSDFDTEWVYRDTHYFNSWLILFYASNADEPLVYISNS